MKWLDERLIISERQVALSHWSSSQSGGGGRNPRKKLCLSDSPSLYRLKLKALEVEEESSLGDSQSIAT